jgi:hypothetical protein
VLRACRERLWNDQLVEEFVTEFTRIVNRGKGEAQAERVSAERELARVEKDMAALVQSIQTASPAHW